MQKSHSKSSIVIYIYAVLLFSEEKSQSSFRFVDPSRTSDVRSIRTTANSNRNFASWDFSLNSRIPRRNFFILVFTFETRGHYHTHLLSAFMEAFSSMMGTSHRFVPMSRQQMPTKCCVWQGGFLSGNLPVLIESRLGSYPHKWEPQIWTRLCSLISRWDFPSQGSFEWEREGNLCQDRQLSDQLYYDYLNRRTSQL